MTENEAKVKLERTSVLWNNAKLTEIVEAVKVAIQAIERVQKFEAIGTIEEFKALKEKNEPKRPICYDKHHYKCPICGEELGVDDDSIYIYEEELPNYCSKCGQKLDWQ